MSVYQFRERHFFNQEIDRHQVQGKLAFKTRETDWINSLLPAIVPMSIHTAFHEGICGHMKMEAFISTLKKHLHGKLTILMAEGAHLNALSLKHTNAAELCNIDSRDLVNRFRHLFSGLTIAHWEESITFDPHYRAFRKKILDLYHTDQHFQELLRHDAEASYSPERSLDYPNKDLYLQRTIQDILEQCIAFLVLASNGYRWLFYPGRQYSAIEYVNQKGLMSLVHVFISIEKKLILPLCRAASL